MRGLFSLMQCSRFNGRGDGEGRKTKIDFIHLRTSPTPEHGRRTPASQSAESQNLEQSQWQVQGHAVLPNRFEDGIYISDHRAVVGDVVLPAKC